MVMRYRAFFILLLLFGALVNPIQAASESRYAYIAIEKVAIDLQNERTTLQVSYSLDTPIKVIFWLLGTSDLKNKLIKMINYENVTVKEIGFDRAVFTIEGAVIDYQDGAFWFPEHTFNAVIPSLSISTPQSTLRYSYTNRLSRGVGYFKVPTVTQ